MLSPEVTLGPSLLVPYAAIASSLLSLKAILLLILYLRLVNPNCPLFTPSQSYWIRPQITPSQSLHLFKGEFKWYKPQVYYG